METVETLLLGATVPRHLRNVGAIASLGQLHHNFPKLTVSPIFGSDSTPTLAKLFLTVTKIIVRAVKAKAVTAEAALMAEVMIVAVIHSSVFSYKLLGKYPVLPNIIQITRILAR